MDLKPSSLVFHATKEHKRFALELDFYDDIIPEDSTWSFASVGRVKFTFKKKDNETIWPRLTKVRATSSPSSSACIVIVIVLELAAVAHLY